MKLFYFRAFLVAGFFLLNNQTVNSQEDGVSYVSDDKPLVEIDNVHRQSEAWAMCSATYDMAAEIFFADQPSQAERIRQLANGAQISVLMSIVANELDEDITADRFNSLWQTAQLAAEERPKISRTFLAAEAESYGSGSGDGIETFLANLSATFQICIENLDGQQFYIDFSRELTKSGLLSFPEE